ncbi:hypothetical protein HS088_TW22G00465 [Tripterygium wilfordii]|uniref:Glycosyltransferase family 92 protein n=1 Tax=Tripterygium wilfordii TaxID=458696 RepID=A0A7J7BY27_TRIWF|nr:glycosyltransferase family 92 protein RCOM_0530710-like [Tripterygium wilfordii]KAF5726783.1 hypothetical protein HS088_TW22G00465 [Tripterygium wilfordii]
MESEQQRRKRKRFYRSYAYTKLLSLRSLLLSSTTFVFLFFICSHRFTFHTASFHPAVRVSSSLSLSLSRLVLDSSSINTNIQLPIRVEDRVVFTDHLLLIVSDKIIDQSLVLECLYYSNDSVNRQVISQRAFSFDEFQEHKSIVRCPLPRTNYSSLVTLKRTGDVADADWSRQMVKNQSVLYWDRLAYVAALDGNSVLVFVKGLNLRPHRESNPSQLLCKFGFGSLEKDQGFVFTAKAIKAAQEVVRCLLPRSIRNNADKAQEVRVTVVHANDAVPVPSMARIHDLKSSKIIQGQKYELCACTMLWNQAFALREWIMYHAWLGVDRWFIYDNNSDDGIEEVIDELELKNYNVSRHVWPWIKSQEAGFSHCALRARSECKWVGFFDVDEFFFFPPQGGRQVVSSQNGLRSLIANYSSSSNTIAEIRTDCHSFGPSGLSSHPLQGVTAGYTCRLQSSERHKSIVRPEALDLSLLNIVHHFKLRVGFRYLNVPETTAVINHYKYQAWETFKAKFYRRVSSYVVDWQEDQNKGSKDRAPGLGTEAVEPPDWGRRFCEVWDTGLRDFVLANFADAATGFLPWERSLR